MGGDRMRHASDGPLTSKELTNNNRPTNGTLTPLTSKGPSNNNRQTNGTMTTIFKGDKIDTIHQSSSQSVSSSSPLTKSTSEVISLSSTISASSSVETVKDPTKTITVKTIFEEVVDGKVVSSRVEKIEQTLI